MIRRAGRQKSLLKSVRYNKWNDFTLSSRMRQKNLTLNSAIKKMIYNWRMTEIEDPPAVLLNYIEF